MHTYVKRSTTHVLKERRGLLQSVEQVPRAMSNKLNGIVESLDIARRFRGRLNFYGSEEVLQ